MTKKILPALSPAQERETKKLRSRIQKATTTRKKMDVAVRYLRSHNAKLEAVYAANRALRPSRRPSQDSLLATAENLDPWKGSDEEVRVHLEFKPNSHEFRPIQDFRITNKALQILVASALRSQMAVHSKQYMFNGGTPAAVNAVKQAMEEGYKFAMLLDIKSFFPSVDQQGLEDLLPIPREVTKRVISSRHFNIKLFDNMFSTAPVSEVEVDPKDTLAFMTFAEARRGIPQGAVSSPYVAEMLLTPIVSKIQSYGPLVNYADNFVVFGESEGEVETLAQALGGALEAHPAGSFILKREAIWTPEKKLPFLGYELSLQSGKSYAVPTQINRHEFSQEFASRLISLANMYASKKQKKEKLKRLRAYVKSWCKSFNQWPEFQTFRIQHLNKIDEVAQKLMLESPEEPKKAA